MIYSEYYLYIKLLQNVFSSIIEQCKNNAFKVVPFSIPIIPYKVISVFTPIFNN